MQEVHKRTNIKEKEQYENLAKVYDTAINAMEEILFDS